jgi:hypothetical protein
LEQIFSRDTTRTGPAVRSASLLEQRGFEPPVLFVVPGAYERLEVFSGVTALKPIRELFSERSGGKFWPKTAGLPPLFQGAGTTHQSRATNSSLLSLRRSRLNARRPPSTRPSGQFLQQRLGSLQIQRIVTFGEPAVDRCEEVKGFGAFALVLPEARRLIAARSSSDLAFCCRLTTSARWSHSSLSSSLHGTVATHPFGGTTRLPTSALRLLLLLQQAICGNRHCGRAVINRSHSIGRPGAA